MMKRAESLLGYTQSNTICEGDGDAGGGRDDCGDYVDDSDGEF
jgi:hypothetical protein